MKPNRSWWYDLVCNSGTISEDEFIENYDDIKKHFNFMKEFADPDGGIVKVSNNTSMLTAPREFPAIHFIKDKFTWAKESNWSDRLRVFLRLKGEI
jgi:hypothetical protein